MYDDSESEPSRLKDAVSERVMLSPDEVPSLEQMAEDSGKDRQHERQGSIWQAWFGLRQIERLQIARDLHGLKGGRLDTYCKQSLGIGSADVSSMQRLLAVDPGLDGSRQLIETYMAAAKPRSKCPTWRVCLKKIAGPGPRVRRAEKEEEDDDDDHDESGKLLSGEPIDELAKTLSPEEAAELISAVKAEFEDELAEEVVALKSMLRVQDANNVTLEQTIAAQAAEMSRLNDEIAALEQTLEAERARADRAEARVAELERLLMASNVLIEDVPPITPPSKAARKGRSASGKAGRKSAAAPPTDAENAAPERQTRTALVRVRST